MSRGTYYAVGAAMLLLLGVGTRAEHTREWRQSTYEEFLKGAARGVAVRSDGKLELAPKFTSLADADASYLWAVRMDAKGTLYAAGGTPAKVFRLEASGKLTTVFESSDLSAQAIAFDSKGVLYVGTNPDGKVYRVSASGEKSVFFEPKTKYIWDLAFAPDGTLYVATGDKGQIFEVNPEGKGELFYASDEAHIRVLAFDAKGNLIAGTEPSGRILRLTRAKGKTAKDSPGGSAEGFVLYETPKREVTALAVGPDGSIYAAAIGERQHTAQVSSGVAGGAQTSNATTTITSAGNVTVIGPTTGIVQGPSPFVAFPPLLTGSVYKIAPDGAPEELWSSREEVVYSLAIGLDGRLLAGTGNNGTVLAIDGRGVFAQLAKAGSAQVTGIAKSANGKIYLCTANPGKLAAIGPEYEEEGTFESRSFDAQLFSQWGRLDWFSPPVAKATGSAPRLEFFVRSGNTEDPGREWSRWYGPYGAAGSPVEAPPARFAQWKAVIHDGRPGDGIDWVSLAYEPRNVAPVIDAIVLQEANVRAQAVTLTAVGQTQSVALRLPPAATVTGGIVSVQTTAAKFEAPPQGFAQQGWRSVLWSAHDDNDDDLRYAVYFRGEGEREWKLLKDKLDQRFYAFDTTSLADGAYYLKMVADDAQSNPPANAKTAERESERFVVDNTPPVVSIQEAVAFLTKNGTLAPVNGAVVNFTAKDNLSAIDRAEYSVDGGEWILVSPKTGISDSREESYEFTASGLRGGEHTIAVRAYDRFDNVGSAKATVKISAARP